MDEGIEDQERKRLREQIRKMSDEDLKVALEKDMVKYESPQFKEEIEKEKKRRGL